MINKPDNKSKESIIKECERLLLQKDINATQLKILIDARKSNYIDFNLVDVREQLESFEAKIKYTDYFIPTTSFYESLKQIKNQKEIPTIIYCHVGQRSAYCQKVMIEELGFKQVINLYGGIAQYEGEILYTQSCPIEDPVK